MKFFKILFIVLMFVFCKTENKIKVNKSNFSLEKDYEELTTKMTDLDTIKVWMNLSQCMYQGIEKLKIIRKADSLEIHPEFKNTMEFGVEFKKLDVITIPITDTVWKFNEFLKRNKSILETDSLKYGRLQIVLNNEKLSFMTKNLSDSGAFLIDYCSMMKNIIPKSDYHIYTEVDAIVENKMIAN